MIDAHLMKLRARDDVSAEEEKAIRGLVSEVTTFRADRTIIRHGEELHHSVLLLEGWVARVKGLPAGEHQVTEINIAGDFIDLHGFTLKHLDHDLVSMTPCTAALVPHARLEQLTVRYPHLARLYWFMTNLDAAIHREWTLSLGRRSALSRMAHLFCELNVRLGVVGLAHCDRYDFPLTQAELAECLGLTPVHVNRTLQELRRLGLVELESRRLTIIDIAGLKAVADFDQSYLYVERRPR